MLKKFSIEFRSGLGAGILNILTPDLFISRIAAFEFDVGTHPLRKVYFLDLLIFEMLC